MSGNGLPNRNPEHDPLDAEIEVMCVNCEFEWIAVCYKGMDLFRCPMCESLSGKPLGHA